MRFLTTDEHDVAERHTREFAMDLRGAAPGIGRALANFAFQSYLSLAIPEMDRVKYFKIYNHHCENGE